MPRKKGGGVSDTAVKTEALHTTEAGVEGTPGDTGYGSG